ncbi:hypothetical protein Y027_4053 [Burkholderia pseudomallei TSV5]|nr:hypothetical protein Y027_4053 [Burkholderia pseudomallei TSV5]
MPGQSPGRNRFLRSVTGFPQFPLPIRAAPASHRWRPECGLGPCGRAHRRWDGATFGAT